MNSVERVKTICKERKIPISKHTRTDEKKENAGNPHKYGTLGISSSERAGIRTPDNLIKSQEIEYPQTPEI